MTDAKRTFRSAGGSGWLCVGLLVATLCCVGCPPSDDGIGEGAPAPATTAPAATEPVATAPAAIEALARTDQVKLLKIGLARTEREITRYTCLFVKRERMRGTFEKAPEQHIKVKFKEDPFSVAMAWVKNPPRGDRIIYIEGKHDGRMLVRPKGLSWLTGTLLRDPAGKDAMRETLRPVTMFGFRRGLENLLKVYELAGKAGDGVTSFGGYALVDGESTMKLIRTLPKKEGYPAKKTVIFLGVDRLIALRLEGYDWDDKLYCTYEYRDVDFDAKLTDADFTPQANGMKPVK